MDTHGYSIGEGSPLTAELVYDTRCQELPIGVRAVAQRARTLLFAAEALEIVLQVAPYGSTERLLLMGQVLLDGEPIPAATVRLGGPAVGAHGLTDEDGEFRLGELPPGGYRLEIATAERLVECTPLDL